MSDTRVATNDPVFFLHHAYIDKMWDDWQMLDEQQRVRDYNGASIQSRLPGYGNTRVADVMSNRQQMCVRYQPPSQSVVAIREQEEEESIVPQATVTGTNLWLLGQRRMDPAKFTLMEQEFMSHC